VDDSAEVAAEETEKTPDDGLEIGVSRSEENSNPGRFPRWSASGGNEVTDGGRYMLLMYADDLGGEGPERWEDCRYCGRMDRKRLPAICDDGRTSRLEELTPRLGSSTNTAIRRKSLLQSL